MVESMGEITHQELDTSGVSMSESGREVLPHLHARDYTPWSDTTLTYRRLILTSPESGRSQFRSQAERVDGQDQTMDSPCSHSVTNKEHSQPVTGGISWALQVLLCIDRRTYEESSSKELI
jgi:hypothetical protein